MERLVITGTISILVLSTIVGAQQTATATRASGLEVDGRLEEPVWRSAAKHEMRHNMGTMLTDGSVDDENDLSSDFALLWDDNGFYCGIWRRDDIHNTYYGSQPELASKAWRDDGHEWFISFDFNDVWEDASAPYFGQFGYQIWEALCWENGAAADMYVSHTNGNGAVSLTVSEMREQGFYAPYHSTDGINFTCETRFEWSSAWLGGMATPSAGKEIGFNLSTIDNDGGQTGDAWLRWTGGAARAYQSWGKITLSEETGIRPVRRSFVSQRNSGTGGNAFDIFGRRISGNLYGKVLIFGNAGQRYRNTKRAIILR